MVQQRRQHKWGMVVDIDRCIGCQACVVACQAENNIPINDEKSFRARRAYEWIRIERYWEGEFPNVKARFMPVLCQHCENAPCEPVCPVFATYHNNEGMNVQIYNRCVGTRYCANNCPYQVRFFNYWEPVWPESLRNQLNPDVTVRSRGIMEKCSFCVQRLRRAERTIEGQEGGKITDQEMWQRNLMPACVHACPTSTLVFGDLLDPDSQVSRMKREGLAEGGRGYKLLESLGTEPNVVYLKKVDIHAKAEVATHA
ncbi:MAG: 4Fe-4S dicluster domain-containing protein [Chloroflexi bacterium]|nr:4Fe-4S dicluster domain-containing protein [Chloroflexota bacterium]